MKYGTFDSFINDAIWIEKRNFNFSLKDAFSLLFHHFFFFFVWIEIIESINFFVRIAIVGCVYACLKFSVIIAWHIEEKRTENFFIYDRFYLKQFCHTFDYRYRYLFSSWWYFAFHFVSSQLAHTQNYFDVYVCACARALSEEFKKEEKKQQMYVL